MLIIPQNLTAPQTVTLRYLTPSLGANLTTVTSGHLAVLRQDGTQASWPLVIISQTPSEIVCQYTPSSGDITATGTYYLTALFTAPGGTLQAAAIAAYVTMPNMGQSRLEDSAYLVAAGVLTGALTKGTWTFYSTTSALTPFSPWVAADSRAGAITLTLWTAQDGDGIVIADPYGASATHAVTVAGNGSQQVPTGPGTYASSVALSIAGFSLRLRYNAALSKWLAW